LLLSLYVYLCLFYIYELYELKTDVFVSDVTVTSFVYNRRSASQHIAARLAAFNLVEVEGWTF